MWWGGEIGRQQAAPLEKEGLDVAAPDKLLADLLDHPLDRTASFTCISAVYGCLSGLVMLTAAFLCPFFVVRAVYDTVVCPRQSALRRV